MLYLCSELGGSSASVCLRRMKQTAWGAAFYFALVNGVVQPGTTSAPWYSRTDRDLWARCWVSGEIFKRQGVPWHPCLMPRVPGPPSSLGTQAVVEVEAADSADGSPGGLPRSSPPPFRSRWTDCSPRRKRWGGPQADADPPGRLGPCRRISSTCSSRVAETVPLTGGDLRHTPAPGEPGQPSMHLVERLGHQPQPPPGSKGAPTPDGRPARGYRVPRSGALVFSPRTASRLRPRTDPGLLGCEID